VAFRVSGIYGTILIATAVLMACLSTAIALAAVVGEYTQITLFKNRISFIQALLLVLVTSLPLSIAGLGQVMKITGGPLVYIGYPVIIALTVCNIAYKLFGFTWVKLPVFATFTLALISYYLF
jgi:LIVCS family branched-chain amino acid:cation transporter